MYQYLEWCCSAFNQGFFELLLYKHLEINRSLLSVQFAQHPLLYCAEFFRKILVRTAHLPPESEKQHFGFCSLYITSFKGRAFVQRAALDNPFIAYTKAFQVSQPAF